MTRDEAISTFIAAEQIEALYNAYRATSLASIWVSRISQRNLQKNQLLETEEGILNFQELLEKQRLSEKTDLVFTIRIQQIQRRISELKNLNEKA